MKPKTIILAGGGSGGHIAPLLPLARALKNRDPNCRVIYIGLKKDRLEGLAGRFGVFDKVYFVPAGKLRRYHSQSFFAQLIDFKTLFLNILDLFKVIVGTGSALRLLRKIKPDVVFSKGGYVAVPIGLAARLSGVRIITHDSDATAGLANRLIGRWASLHTTAQPAKHYFKFYRPNSIEYVGIPTDERLKSIDHRLQVKYKKQLGISEDSFVLLVSGGGHGSQTLNQKVSALAPELMADPKVYILHFCGQMHKDRVLDEYKRNLTSEQFSRLRVIGFSDEFYKYASAADLVIARAGASTLAELAILAKACIVIPAEFLAGGHQIKNVNELARAGAVSIHYDQDDTKNLLRQIIELKQNPKRRARLAANLGSTARADAADKIAKILLS